LNGLRDGTSSLDATARGWVGGGVGGGGGGVKLRNISKEKPFQWVSTAGKLRSLKVDGKKKEGERGGQEIAEPLSEGARQ